MDVIEKFRDTTVLEGRVERIALETGNVVGGAEEALLTMGTSRVYRFRLRHPWLYGIIAFIIGGGFISVFTMTTYTNWVYQSINLKVALYQVVFGGLGGGVVAVILAFAYTAAIRPTLPAMRSDGVITR
jgi:hypothetical protein